MRERSCSVVIVVAVLLLSISVGGGGMEHRPRPGFQLLSYLLLPVSVEKRELQNRFPYLSPGPRWREVPRMGCMTRGMSVEVGR